MAKLALQHVSVSIEDKLIVSNVSLTVPAGEIHVLMGPNGSGKSTLAAAVAGHPHYTVEPKSKVFVGNTDILPLAPHERAHEGFFLAFQHPLEIPGLSLFHYFQSIYAARFGPIVSPDGENSKYGFPSLHDFLKYIQGLALQAGFSKDVFHRNLNEGFSGGERKRLELLQMMLLKPAAAILDETDSGLDVDALKSICQGIREVVKENNTAALVVTHYQRIIPLLQPDAIHILVNGKLVESGGIELAAKIDQNGYKPYGAVRSH